MRPTERSESGRLELEPEPTPPFLRALRTSSEFGRLRGFPFDLEVLRDLDRRGRFELRAAVTFLVGENGSGKSTILESLALALGCVAAGSDDLDRDPTLVPARRLAKQLVLEKSGRLPRAKLFFRAEDAFGFTRRLVYEQRLLEDLEREFSERFEDGSWAQRLAMGTARAQRQALVARYGEDPDGRSHGETFLDLLAQRVVKGGLYLLDEPETPLSPVHVLALIVRLMRAVDEGSQFVIATHSPMLMALPGAEIVRLDGGTLQRSIWSDLEHVTVLRGILNDPEAYLRRLAAGD